ncbi:hypothetical protein OG883_45695 [Streptomyces sp. NBC_01142]|uniref:hypothetical protein n=1 Tax=Streptomyces sp. NBC_01142 TaxID=2975865 RepID=UPI00224D31D1|nr:hypothetical protein [Streptomyces sp. NBC_01142]MCX4826934.1 hypothetical protein [Streptomyces sp. NBC_01142]
MADPPPAHTARTVREALGFSDELWRRYTAIHEAGHAVAAMTDEDAALVRSTLVDTTTADGRSIGGFTDLSSTSARGIAVVLHGGFLAQERWLHELNLDTPARLAATRAAATHDFEQLTAYGLPRSLLLMARNDAERLRDDHWPVILAVADILDTQGTITAAEAFVAHGRAMAHDSPAPALLAPQQLSRLDALIHASHTRADQNESTLSTAAQHQPTSRTTPPPQTPAVHTTAGPGSTPRTHGR